MQAKKILIVDDDRSICESLGKALTKKGFEAVVCSRANEALEKIKISEYQAIFLDCMLPQLNGVDLAAKISQENLSNAPIYLMSGIYKDKRYIREALAKSKASDFITKPFNIDTIFKLISQTSVNTVELLRPPLFRIFSNPEATASEILQAIENSDSFHGFDLPVIYSFLMGSKITGHLEIQEANGDKYVISFLPNKIVNVETNHKKSYLGVLLVEKGYCTKETIENIMAANTSKRIGERLVEANLISPHAIEEVMVDQFIIRLSKTIWDTSITASFSPAPNIHNGPGIKINDFYLILHDWMYSKIPFSWLKTFYVTWMDQPIIGGPNIHMASECYQLPVFRRLPNIDRLLISNRTPDRLLSDGKFNERDFFTALHYLAARRIICFASKEELINFENALARLQRIKAEFEKKDYFQILNVSRHAPEAEIKQSYHELAKNFHPDRLPTTAPESLKALTKEIFSMLSTAFNTLKDANSRKDYIRQLELGQAEDLLQAEALFEQGKQHLKSGQAQLALNCFNQASTKKLNNPRLNLYKIWAQLRMYEAGNKTITIRDMDSALDEIPPEDRHDALYFFVKGLFLKIVGTQNQAKNFFERSIALDSSFLEAHRELNLMRLKMESSNTKSFLQQDITTLLFGKKKR